MKAPKAPAALAPDEDVVTLDVERWRYRPPKLAYRSQITSHEWNRLESWRDVAVPDATDRFIARLISIACYYLQLVETAPPVLVEGDGRLVWAKDGAEVDDLFDALDAVDAWLVRQSTLESDVRREAWTFAVGDTPLPSQG